MAFVPIALLIVVGNPYVLATDARWRSLIQYCNDLGAVRGSCTGLAMDELLLQSGGSAAPLVAAWQQNELLLVEAVGGPKDDGEPMVVGLVGGRPRAAAPIVRSTSRHATRLARSKCSIVTGQSSGSWNTRAASMD